MAAQDKPQAQPPLGVGDPFGAPELVDLAGQAFKIAAAELSGYTHLLWLCRAVPPPEAIAQGQALAERLGLVEAELTLVMDGPDLPAGLGEAGFRVVRDPRRIIADGYGIGASALVVLAPHGRVAALLPGDALEEAAAHAERLFARTRPQTITLGAPALIVPDVLEPAFCQALIQAWESQPEAQRARDTITTGHKLAETGRPQVKRRDDVLVKDPALIDGFRRRFIRRVIPELKRAFCFDVVGVEPLKVGCYDAGRGGWFTRHRDNSSSLTAHRSFAMTLNLNTDEYEGGELRFPEFGRATYRPPAGGAVLFSCTLLHEALPVTKGRRFGVFTFLSDAAGAAREKALTEQMRREGKAPA